MKKRKVEFKGYWILPENSDLEAEEFFYRYVAAVKRILPEAQYVCVSIEDFE